ncbi:MAG: carboxypeptidase M32 [Elusimicrobia bacterium]|nr:carboxypeptidase M32 [Elusimicrobiota bacterium]
MHARLTSKEFGGALGTLCDLRTGAPDAALSPREGDLLRPVWRRFRRARSLPARLVSETAEAASASQHAWAEARRRSDFKLLRPHLERIVRLKREAAACLGGAHPYDPLLDEYEPGMTVAELDGLFGSLKGPLVALAGKARGRGRRLAALADSRHDGPSLDIFCRSLASDMGFDLSRGVIARSAHPFSTGLHPTDVRFTIRTTGDGVMNQALSALHECGHALYEQSLDPRWWGTPLGEYASLGMHEAMSRLWENLVGKSREFWLGRWPSLRRAFPEALDGVSVDAALSHMRRVAPGTVRLESDEVTYSLHIILRYELEKSLADGSLAVRDIQEAWNELSRELLGLAPVDDRRGCLQDIHWAGGLIGYFPTYALGNLYGAQLYARFCADHPGWDARLTRGELAPLTAWLKEKVYRHGRRWPAAELVRRATGRAPSTEAFLAHLDARYAHG